MEAEPLFMKIIIRIHVIFIIYKRVLLLGVYNLSVKFYDTDSRLNLCRIVQVMLKVTDERVPWKTSNITGTPTT